MDMEQLNRTISSYFRTKGRDKEAEDFECNSAGLSSLWLHLKQCGDYDGIPYYKFLRLLSHSGEYTSEDGELIERIAKVVGQFDSRPKSNPSISSYFRTKGRDKEAEDFECNIAGLSSLWLYLKQHGDYDGISYDEVFRLLSHSGEYTSEDGELIERIAKVVGQFDFSSKSNPLGFSYSITVPIKDLTKYEKLLKDIQTLSGYDGYRMRCNDEYYAVYGNECCTSTGMIQEDKINPQQDQIVTLEFVGGDFTGGSFTGLIPGRLNIWLNEYLVGVYEERLFSCYTNAIARNDLRSVQLYWCKLRTKEDLALWLESASYYDFTPLMWAIVNDQKHIVRQLIRTGMRTDRVPLPSPTLDFLKNESKSYQIFNGFKFSHQVRYRKFGIDPENLKQPKWHPFKLAAAANSPAALDELFQNNGSRRMPTFLTYSEWSALSKIAKEFGSEQVLEYLNRFKISKVAQNKLRKASFGVVVALLIPVWLVGFGIGIIAGLVVGIIAVPIITIGYYLSARNDAQMATPQITQPSVDSGQANPYDTNYDEKWETDLPLSLCEHSASSRGLYSKASKSCLYDPYDIRAEKTPETQIDPDMQQSDEGGPYRL